MSDYKFPCPHCNLTISGPMAGGGGTVLCPSCNGPIILQRSSQQTDTHRRASRSSVKAEAWKVFAGVGILLLAVPMLLATTFVTIGFVSPSLAKVIFGASIFNELTPRPFVLPIIIVLLGRLFVNQSTVGKLLYCLVFGGIIPGFVVLKGWEAIEEGTGKACPKI